MDSCKNSRVGVVIPTLNASRNWAKLSQGIRLQGLAPLDVLIVDSSSTDNTAALADKEGFRVLTIARSEFNHGGTRQLAVENLIGTDLIVFLTQDVEISEPDAITNLTRPFVDPMVAASFGRQAPRSDATPIEVHARLFNYPKESSKRSFADRGTLGIKAIFLSNAFSCYRRQALQSIGGFRRRIIFGEDTIAAAGLLRAGWTICYVAEATVTHSHNYTIGQEFGRYFDIGALHSMERRVFADYGKATGEGKRFVVSELQYLRSQAPQLIPLALTRTAAKAVAYRAGRCESLFAGKLKKHISMQPSFWTAEKPSLQS